MEIVFWIIGILVVLSILGAIFSGSMQCSICETSFGEKSKKYETVIDGRKVTICTRCNRKISNKASDEKFDAFFNNSKESKQSDNDRNIPSKTKNAVWKRDEGKCVNCGSNEKLEFDHIIPVSKGGSNTMRNVQLLCEKCNRIKSDKIQ